MATIGQPTLYKMVTPPKGEGSGMGSLVKSMNSLGATINSIAFIAADMNKNFAKGIKHQISKQEDISKKHTNIENKKLTDKKKKEAALRKLMNRRQDQDAEGDQKSIIAQFGGTMIKAAKGVLGFFEGLAAALEAIFVGFVSYAVFTWLGKAENKKKVKKFLDFMSALGKFIVWAVTGLVDMGLSGITEFLENPVSFEGLFGLVKFLTALGLVFAPGATISVALAGVMTLFKAGRLVPLLKGFFTGVWGLVKGLLAFLARRPLVAGLLLAAGWGAYMIFGNDDEGEADAVDNIEDNQKERPTLENSSEKEVLSAMDERIIALQNQIESMTWWEKLTTNQDDRLRQEIVEIKNERQTDTSEDVTPKVDEKKDEKLPEKKQGGSVVIPSNPFIPKMDNGGWITGPQSGYPVSLDGGGSTSFIGHGTEWVGFPKASRGGAFVVPFDTPSTRTNPSLTKKRLGEAQRGGFTMPSFDMGGFYPQMQVGGLLDFIASGEGGYNSMNQGTKGNSIVGSTHDSASIVKKKLTDMSVGEIMERQAYLMNKSNPQESDYGLFAVGRYQVIPGTMSSIVKTMGIDRNAKFDKQMQDKIGLGLIKHKRPYAWKYINKEHNDRTGAMKALAAEWASLPDPATGRSMYGGGNASSHSVEEVAAALDAARGGAPLVSDDVVEKIQPAKAWWDPLGVFSGKKKELTTGNTIGESALNEFDKYKWGTGEESVSVQPMQLPAIDTTPPVVDEDIPEPIFIPNEYEPPAHPYITARFGMMADVNTCPDRLF